MTRDEAIKTIRLMEYKYLIRIGSIFDTALDMAIEALKAQDRPIICPRCGRTFAESEGRE